MQENRYDQIDAATYEQVRPAYPTPAVTAILEEGTAPKTVVDVGAGTGKFARQLVSVAPSVQVEAIEPAPAMRELWSSHPRIRVHPGTAEDTGLPLGSADRIVWAQSFHWVKRELTARESLRLLRPGGFGAVLVNQMDVAVPWVHRLTRIMRSGDVIKETWNPTLAGFTTRGPRVYRWDQELPVKDVLSLGRTRTSYLGSPPQVQTKMQQNLRWYLQEHLGYAPNETIAIPYLTYLWFLYPEG